MHDGTLYVNGVARTEPFINERPNYVLERLTIPPGDVSAGVAAVGQRGVGHAGERARGGARGGAASCAAAFERACSTVAHARAGREVMAKQRAQLGLCQHTAAGVLGRRNRTATLLTLLLPLVCGQASSFSGSTRRLAAPINQERDS